MTYPNTVISMPSQLFTMRSSFKAVANGSVYIGEVDADPTIPTNQIQVYIEQENGTIVPVAQPIKINSAGLLTASGQVQKFVLTNTEYSMTVQNSYGVDEFYFPRVYDQGISAALEVEERLLGPGAKIYRGSNGQYVENGDVVPIENPPYTHLSVPINGKAEDVSMSPVASGAVSLLTETSATIGGTPVDFEPHINTNTASSGALGSLSPLAKTIKEILNFTVDTKFYLLYDGSDEGSKINMLIANVAASGIKRKIIFHAGEISSSVSILIKSGNYDVEFDRNCKITFSAGIDGFVIGDEGSSTFEGSIKNPWVIKETLEASDNAFKFVNFTGEMHNPRQEGFAYAYTAKPTNSSRVAYSVIYNPRSRNHKRMIFLQPQDNTSYVNSNSFIGGRAENFTEDRLEYNALLDNQSGNGCQHNLIDSTIFEGYSGAATNCGNASVKCINGANYNEFKHNRNEAYGNGWSETYGVIFDATTVGNNYEDTYYGASVSDLGENNYSYPKGVKKSFISAGSETGNYEIVRNGVVSKPLMNLSDSFGSSGGVNFLKYYTPRTQSRSGRLINLETGYGEVFVVDDAGTLIPRDGFADLGVGSTNRFRALYCISANASNYYVNGVRVVTGQQSAIANSVGGDEQAKINAILAALRAHGLIAN